MMTEGLKESIKIALSKEPDCRFCSSYLAQARLAIPQRNLTLDWLGLLAGRLHRHVVLWHKIRREQND